MRKLAVQTFLSLDGVMQGPGGPEEDPTGRFELGGWTFYLWDDLMVQEMDGRLAEPFELLLGRRTYEIFAAHWPYSEEQPTADLLNHARKYVASRTLETVTWENSALLRGEVARAVAALKQEEGPELQVHGSQGLVQTLRRHDLVDEYRLWIFPVVLGRGKRLFAPEAGAPPAGMRLARCTTSGTGVIMATYERAGGVRCGSFAPVEPSAAEEERRARLAGEPV